MVDTDSSQNYTHLVGKHLKCPLLEGMGRTMSTDDELKTPSVEKRKF